ncbi:hypothetical protein [Hominilimicola sp.]|uniref:hypothetical protein n=1 Tax=Hominilimicola sp. TaxID=3073571 RepID=UPI00307CBD94
MAPPMVAPKAEVSGPPIAPTEPPTEAPVAPPTRALPQEVSKSVIIITSLNK